MHPEFQARTRQGGFTLIEVLVASTLGLLLLSGIGALFLATNRSYRENELVAGMQDQARFAMSTLGRDLAMSGYWGGMMGTGNLLPNLADEDTLNDVTSATDALLPANDCGPAGQPWSFQVADAVEFRNHSASTAITAQWNCIGNHRAGTDALAIRHVAGQTTDALELGESMPTLRQWHFYLQTNGTVGTLMRWLHAVPTLPDAANQPSTAPMSFHRYLPRIYFVRDFSLTPGDGVPTLCRKELCPTGYAANSNPELASCGEAGGSPGALGWFSECLAEGVEDLQIVWGLDDPNDNDAIVDQYTAAPLPADMTHVRSAQVHLLVRSRRANPQHVDEKTYRLADQEPFEPSSVADATGTAADQRTRNFYRRAYSTTVQLRNLGIVAGDGIQ